MSFWTRRYLGYKVFREKNVKKFKKFEFLVPELSERLNNTQINNPKKKSIQVLEPKFLNMLVRIPKISDLVMGFQFG